MGSKGGSFFRHFLMRGSFERRNRGDDSGVFLIKYSKNKGFSYSKLCARRKNTGASAREISACVRLPQRQEMRFLGQKMKTKEEYLADFKKWGLLGGRPKSFKSPKDMAGKIAAWLEASELRVRQVYTKNGVETVVAPAPLLIESFCRFCGITKTTFYEYAKKPDYKPLTDFVQQSSEEYLVRQCVEGPAGNKADFVLKNAFGGEWKDKSDVVMTNNVHIMPSVKVGDKELFINIGENADGGAAGNS